jgi:RimJ/RimL family protein N-acetyltransferase
MEKGDDAMTTFYSEKGLAMCGLACALCGHQACPGCLKDGCENRQNCAIYRCASAKGLAGCYACDQFPCAESMFLSVRVRAFNRFAQAFGVPALMQRLQHNAQDGVVYHRPDRLTGDYDLYATEDEIVRFIQHGCSRPYELCPSFETEHLIIRLVQETDAQDLLACYSDPEAQRFFNADRCTGDFRYGRLDEMAECIRFWLQSYRSQAFVRWSIVEKASHRAVGTIEMFSDPERWGILRVDVASPFETKALFSELFVLAAGRFFTIFQVDRILTKAIPAASERIAALTAAGFIPVNFQGRENYFVLES